jgi:hypothetical protein
MGDEHGRFVRGGRKWDKILKWCQDNGMNWHLRDASQCKKKWEAFTYQWKKIYDYECNIPSGHVSYWAMSPRERRAKEFPLNFSRKLYDIMMLWYPDKEEVNPKDCRLLNSLQVNNQFGGQTKDKGKN